MPKPQLDWNSQTKTGIRSLLYLDDLYDIVNGEFKCQITRNDANGAGVAAQKKTVDLQCADRRCTLRQQAQRIEEFAYVCSRHFIMKNVAQSRPP